MTALAKARRPASGSAKRAKRSLPLATSVTPEARKEVSCTVCALCCTYVAIEINPPNSVPRATELLWYLYHEGVSLYENDGDWMVQFETRCMNLLDDNRCGVYETRPHICREYSEKECEVNTVDDGQTFYEPATFMAYLARRKPRIHQKVAAGFAPPASPVGRPARNPLAFRRRLARVRALGSAS
jgi:Fe-S-cluster containining protein